MKKTLIFLLPLLIFTAAYAQDACEAGASCLDNTLKKPGLGIDAAAFGNAQKEKNKTEKEIDALLEKYKTTPEKDKNAVKAELSKKVAAREEERRKKERAEIARQQEKLKTWSETLDNEEKNKTALAAAEADNLIAGKKTEPAWEKLKSETEKKSGEAKKKALQKASEVKK